MLLFPQVLLDIGKNPHFFNLAETYGFCTLFLLLVLVSTNLKCCIHSVTSLFFKTKIIVSIVINYTSTTITVMILLVKVPLNYSSL